MDNLRTLEIAKMVVDGIRLIDVLYEIAIRDIDLDNPEFKIEDIMAIEAIAIYLKTGCPNQNPIIEADIKIYTISVQTMESVFVIVPHNNGQIYCEF